LALAVESAENAQNGHKNKQKIINLKLYTLQIYKKTISEDKSQNN
jgi:hypothetical protein